MLRGLASLEKMSSDQLAEAPRLNPREPHVDREQRDFFMSVAASLLVLVCGCVPALSRVHDHLSAWEQPTGFKFSKNLERPHQKYTPTRVIAIRTASVSEASAPAELVAAAEASPVRLWIVVAPTPVRAPPGR
jgi:hypothetical protein